MVGHRRNSLSCIFNKLSGLKWCVELPKKCWKQDVFVKSFIHYLLNWAFFLIPQWHDRTFWDFILKKLHWGWMENSWWAGCSLRAHSSPGPGLKGMSIRDISGCRDSPALTVTALTNCSLQLLLPTTRARLVFLISLSTVLCGWPQTNKNKTKTQK